MKTLHQITRTLRGGSALQALALVGATVGGSAIFAAPASAQDYTSGALTGNVETDAGEPVANAEVTVTSVAQGFTRTSTSTSSGSFRVTGLPAGEYNVSVVAPGLPNYRAEGVVVRNSQTSSLTATLSSASADAGGDIVVTGTAIVQSFEGTTTGLTIDVADTFKSVPLNRDLTSLILLAPNTSGGDSAFGNLASIGGASVAENAYYVNGLNITNFDNYLGSAPVPFEFYQTLETKQGGYPAEFGRATGGIINAVSKSGSNDFTAAFHLNWQPEFLSSPGRDLLNCDAGTGLCSPTTNRRLDQSDSYSAIIEMGGPIIRDRLFVYGLAEFRSVETRTISRVGGRSFESTQDDPRLALKVDAYPIDDHHLEFTIFDTRNTRTQNDRFYSEDENGVGTIGTSASVQEFNSGGVSFVGKYTGRFTDWLTVSGAYGRMRDRFDNIGTAGAAAQVYFVNGSGSAVGDVPNGGFFTDQRATTVTTPYDTEREFYRADVDLFFELLGDHHIRAGFDQENNTLEKASVRTGGDFLAANGFLSQAAINQGGGLAILLRAGNQVELNYFNSGGSFQATNRAYYIQDEWALTDRLTLNLGLRRDDFGVDRGDGVPLVRLDENYQPRIGFTYDLFPDRQGKLFGSYGTYNLPFASNTAFRMTGNEFFFRERFAFGGFDAQGLPILGAQITDRADYASACPFGLTPQSSGQNCSVTGDGSVGPSDTLIDANLKATKQTEFIIGYEHQIGEFNVGINYTHRRLDTNAEDVAIDAAVLAYCEREGIEGCEATWTGFHQYTVINPGSDVTVALDGLDGRTITLSADDLGYPKARRTFDAVEFSFDRPFDGTWGVGGSYVWSEAKGNSEGFVQSDFGQSDAGITQDFDQPGFNDGNYGFLPSHRRHRFKLFGNLAPTEALTLGANIRVESPRPLSCFGFHPTDAFANVYGAASRYCGGELVPRGTALETEWIGQFDFKVAFNINIPTGQIVTLRADVFNLFNSQGVQERNEVGDLDFNPGADGLPETYIANPNYGQATNYQTPRYVRLGLDVSF